MAKKMQELTDEDQAMEALGISQPEAIPGTEQADTSNVGLPEGVKTPEPPVDESTKEVVKEVVAEKEVSSTQDEDGKLTEAEKKRRGFQAEADKFKYENEHLKAQIRLMQEQNQQMMNVIAPLRDKYNLNQEQPVVQNKEPDENFIEDGYFDPIKFKEYQKSRDKWFLDNVKNELKSELKQDIQRDQQQQSVNEQLQEVAKEFPDLINPLTGQVDIGRVENEVRQYTTGKTITQLLREARGVVKQQIPDVSGFEAIEKNAKRPPSVADQTEADEKPPEVPEGLRQISETFGDIDLPSNFGGLE